MDEPRGDEREGLLFFGRMSAGISHEIKNVLAVISEIAGLFGDLALAAERGRELNPAQLSRLSQKMAEQIKRADNVARRLNRFAHSVDEPRRRVDLCEEIAFFADLTFRYSERRGFCLEIKTPGKPVPAETDPFALLIALFMCLESAQDAAVKGSPLSLSLDAEDTEAVIAFSGSFREQPAPGPEKRAALNPWLARAGASLAAPGKTRPLEIRLGSI